MHDDPSTDWALTISFAMQAIVDGAAIAAVFLFLSRLWRGKAIIPSAPGHYLILFIGFPAIATHVGSAIRLEYKAWLANLWPLLVMLAVEYTLAVIVTVIGLIAVEKRWKPVFAFLATSSLVALVDVAYAIVRYPSSTQSMYPIPTWIALATVAPLLFAVLVDWRRATKRDWLHWVGVTFWLTSSALTVGYLVGWN